MKVLNPVGEKKSTGIKDKLAPRPDTLSGKVIGIIDDGAGKAYFQQIKKLLQEKVKPARIIHRVRPHLSQPSPIELVDEIAQASDAVIVGIGI